MSIRGGNFSLLIPPFSHTEITEITEKKRLCRESCTFVLPSLAWIVSDCEQAPISLIPIHCPVLANFALPTEKFLLIRKIDVAAGNIIGIGAFLY